MSLFYQKSASYDDYFKKKGRAFQFTRPCYEEQRTAPGLDHKNTLLPWLNPNRYRDVRRHMILQELPCYSFESIGEFLSYLTRRIKDLIAMQDLSCGIVNNVRTIIQRQNEYMYIPDLAP